jgi:hypothetical protein
VSYKTIKTVEAAFKAMGIDLTQVEQMYASVPEDFRKNEIKNFKRSVIVKAINGKWVADWSDTNQKKWFVWWWASKKEPGSPAVGLRLYGCAFDGASAYVGPRHVFETEAQTRHYAEYFKEFDEEFYS